MLTFAVENMLPIGHCGSISKVIFRDVAPILDFERRYYHWNSLSYYYFRFDIEHN